MSLTAHLFSVFWQHHHTVSTLEKEAISAIIEQNNKSILYQDLEELCEALECEISELLTKE